MALLNFQRGGFSQAVAVLQVLLLLSYFFLNIVNVGEVGKALPLLIVFFILAVVGLFLQLWCGFLVIKLHFFVFLFFLAWLSFRVIIDFQNVERLKQVTVATTGGVLLFFLLGTFVRQALDRIIMVDRLGLTKLLLIIFVLASALVFVSFQGRILDRSNIFYIEGVDGGYQRPGNFMIVLFVISSFLYLSIAARFQTRKPMSLLCWLVFYSAGLLFNLINSQLIGSNAATLNVLVIYLMTVVFSLFVFNRSVRYGFLNDYLVLPFSNAVMNKIIKYSVFVSLLGVVAVVTFVQIAGFDLDKIRVLGFGTGENSSVNSRVKILKETGEDQMAYSPFLGDLDVARLKTGDAGNALHNFIPNVIAELGLVGLIIVMLLFVLILRSLLKTMKLSARDGHGFVLAMISFWLFFVYIFLFLYANFAVGKEWPVIWFFLGFAVCVFSSDTGLEKHVRH